jgi:hypothetical protein
VKPPHVTAGVNTPVRGRRVSWVVKSRGRLLLKIVSAAQPLDSALGVHDALFARVEGVAFAAQFHPHTRFSSPGVEHVSARTGYYGVVKFGMNIGLHRSVFIER